MWKFITAFLEWQKRGFEIILQFLYWPIKFFGTLIYAIVAGLIVIIGAIVAAIPALWSMVENAVYLLSGMLSGLTPLEIANGFDNAPAAFVMSALDTMLPVREAIAGFALTSALMISIGGFAAVGWVIRQVKWFILWLTTAKPL